MKTMKGWISTGLVIAIFTLGIAQANAGIIVGDLASPKNDPSCAGTVKVDWGIIVGELTGIIVGNFTGIIVGNVAPSETVDCGIIVGN